MHYCQMSNNVNSKECRKYRRKNRRGRRNLASLKPTSAVHLTNFSLLLPDISKDVRDIAQRSIIFNPSNDETLNALTYASPWAAMATYNPRDIINNVRSTIANVSDFSGFR